MFIDWKAVSAEPNPWLRMWLVTEIRTDMLNAMSIALPEFFSDTEQQPFVPLSILRQLVNDSEGQLWGDVLSELNIPEFGWHGGENSIAPYVPQEYRDLVKQLCAFDEDEGYVYTVSSNERCLIDYKGEACVVVEAWCDGEGHPDQLSFVPTRFIDFDS